ncbi:hypothetical protein AB1N83_012710 [Pleurotus pulmonarius]
MPPRLIYLSIILKSRCLYHWHLALKKKGHRKKMTIWITPSAHPKTFGVVDLCVDPPEYGSCHSLMIKSAAVLRYLRYFPLHTANPTRVDRAHQCR